MGNLESSTMAQPGLQKQNSMRCSPLRYRRAESFNVQSEETPAVSSSSVRFLSDDQTLRPKTPGITRRQSGFASYFRGSDDSEATPPRSPRRPKRAASVRSHSENRKLIRNSADTNSETVLSQSYSSLRLAVQPHFQISGDLTTPQIGAIRRVWKQELKKYSDSEWELAVRLLLQLFSIDPRLQAAFHLFNVPYMQLRENALFQAHVKVLEPVLTFVMTHLHDATAMSKPLQALGARHVNFTRVQYKSIYWKVANQAVIEFVNADRSSRDVFDAWNVLGNFCVEQMRIGYKIEHKIKKVIQRLQNKNAEC